jgi:hypothetical protein
MEVYFGSVNCSNVVPPEVNLLGSPTVSTVYTIPQTYTSQSETRSWSITSAAASSGTGMAVLQDGTCGPQSGLDLIDHTCVDYGGAPCCACSLFEVLSAEETDN